MRKIIFYFVIFFFPVLGQSAGEPIEAKVKTDLAKMASFLGDANTVAFTAEAINVDVTSTLQRLHFITSMRGAIQRPNKVFLEKTGSENTTLVSNGREIILLDRKENKFIRIPFSGDLSALIEKLEDLNVELPFAGLLRVDTLRNIEKQVFRGDHYGTVNIFGVNCSHLALRQDSIDWQAFIAEDGSPKKLIVTSKMLTGMPEHSIFFKEVKRNIPLEEGIFSIQLPKGASEVPVAEGDV